MRITAALLLFTSFLASAADQARYELADPSAVDEAGWGREDEIRKAIYEQLRPVSAE